MKFIKNKGISKTIIRNNNHNNVSQATWDAEYDGNVANISLDLNTNGNNKHYDLQFDNQDLADILNVQSINTPLDKRLMNDFKRQSRQNRHYTPPYIIELETEREKMYPTLQDTNNSDIYNDMVFPNQTKEPFYTHISSPLPNEKLIVPIIKRKSRRKRNKNRKKTRKIYNY